ncbi:glutathione peroxidase [Paenibacillus sp. MDMC362]|uniref:glutathione peroxidase n=1 Tax=Paenibacillus sp. MDMC362 TaxID=2977365 RepID=UPI000DC29743|nr:glutathione peroxidase [Paenibacillus sp. MDMC362]RAR41904.1 glutathione peroxidase [Paenibacillus sp. MDMC362]
MSIYQFQAKSILGQPLELSAYRNKVLLIVNTASRCAYSRQFADLEQLYEQYREEGFEVLGFPCNQFNEKEPGSSVEIQRFCEGHFGVTFTLFEKVDVRGASAHPLFSYLTHQAPFQGFDTQTSSGQWMQDFLLDKYPEIYAGNGIKWNFTKFLIDRNGKVAGRYETVTEPREIEPIIESLL